MRLRFPKGYSAECATDDSEMKRLVAKCDERKVYVVSESQEDFVLVRFYGHSEQGPIALWHLLTPEQMAKLGAELCKFGLVVEGKHTKQFVEDVWRLIKDGAIAEIIHL